MPLANSVERVILPFRSSRAMHDYLIDRARALLQLALLGRLQRRPRLFAHYSVGHKSVRLLELFNRFLGQRSKFSVGIYVQKLLQPLHVQSCHTFLQYHGAVSHL